MEYTREERRKIFEKLPADLKEAILSTDNSDKLQAIAEKHSIMLDQLGELGDELSLLMLGLTSQNTFVENVARRLSISHDESYQISKEINTEILDAVRDSLKKIQEDSKSTEPIEPPPQTKPINTTKNLLEREVPPNLSPLEQAGGFTLEKQPVSNSPLYKDAELNKEEVLKEIESVDNIIGIKNEE